MRRTPRKVHTLAALALALACLAPCGAGGRASVRVGPPVAASAETREGRLRIFDEVWETVRSRYYDPAMGGVDWLRAREEFRPAAASARGASEFYAVLRRMLSSLRDPHTRVSAPGEADDWREARYISVGLSVRELEGEVLVTRVERGTEAERAGVRAGDSVVTVDGEPAPALITRLVKESTSPSPQTFAARVRGEASFSGVGASSATGVRAASVSARMLAASRMFDGPAGSRVRVVFGSEGRGVRDAELRREWRTRLPSLVARREGRFAVVSFNLFTTDTAALFARALRVELKGARGVVIDLRENGGGDSEAMTDVASLFLDAGQSLGRFTDRDGSLRVEPRTRAALLSSPEAAPADRGVPLVVLTGARTASAAEVFAAALKESGRAVLVGETTCGCVLGIRRRHRLPDGGMLDISETDYHTAGGARLEGTGVAPDENITLTRRDLRRSRDTTMLRALELLKRKR